MIKEKNADLIKRIGYDCGFDVSRETLERFENYRLLLTEWNEKINLTAITEEDDVYLKHFADSIMIYRRKEIRNCKKVIDVGTGAGFPGLPMKILNPEIRLTLLDPLNKRLNFLKEVVNADGLEEVEFIHGRAEDVSRETSYRDSFDLAVSRAVATLPILSEYCVPFVKTGGYFAALKGPSVHDELSKNRNIFRELNSEIIDIEEYEGIEEFNHNIVLIRKTGPTPQKFPRKTVQIKKDMEKYKNS